MCVFGFIVLFVKYSRGTSGLEGIKSLIEFNLMKIYMKIDGT
jgi:hypothetical protein